jgi:hypothetical protein
MPRPRATAAHRTERLAAAGSLVKFKVEMANHKIETNVNRPASDVFATRKSWIPAASVECSIGATIGTSDIVGEPRAEAVNPEENPAS